MTEVAPQILRADSGLPPAALPHPTWLYDPDDSAYPDDSLSDPLDSVGLYLKHIQQERVFGVAKRGVMTALVRTCVAVVWAEKHVDEGFEVPTLDDLLGRARLDGAADPIARCHRVTADVADAIEACLHRAADLDPLSAHRDGRVLSVALTEEFAEEAYQALLIRVRRVFKAVDVAAHELRRHKALSADRIAEIVVEHGA